ncbi:MAG: rod shape-determining protein MreC [Candidatus Doudnabacteria bacterium]
MPRFFRSKSGIILLAMGVITLLIFLHYVKVLRPVENAIFVVTAPVERAAFKTVNKIDNFFHLLTAIRDLARENQDLSGENYRLIAENVRLKEIEKENAFLRDQLKFKEKGGVRGIDADVVGRNPDNLIQSLKINRGAQDNVRVGAPVIFGEGFLVGKVIEVFSKTATVLLITDQNSVVNALIIDSRASGNIYGQHGLGLTMEMIPQNEIVQVGDTVITSGLSGELPKGLVIGEIVKVESNSGELFQKAQVRSYVNFSKLEKVLVVTDINPSTTLQD